MDKDFNILLLGETGVGKSTFINSFINYLHYPTLKEAREGELFCEIPTSFVITDDDFEEKEIFIGDNTDRNEVTEIGESSTQEPRSYEFKLNNKVIRLIDTPGMGDSRGTQFDKKNCESVLNHLNDFNKLNAICFLLKPDVTVINPYFKFCITNLFSRLEKSASNNIIFIFTNTRTTSYRPGQTLTNLKKILQEIKSTKPYVDIPCKKDNIFCMDNEAFRFLVALRNNIQFSEEEIEDFDRSWKKSSQICWNFIEYLPNLIPHDVRDTIAINKARMTVLLLFKPLLEMDDFIQTTLTVIQDKEEIIKDTNISISDLQKQLKKTSIDVKIIPLPRSVLACRSDKCSERYIVHDIEKFHYRICIEAEDISMWWKIMYKIYLRMFRKRVCQHCGCNYMYHDFSSYKTEYVAIEEEDESVKVNIETEEEKVKIQQEELQRSEAEKEKLITLQTRITKSIVKLVYYLQENAILPFNDAYEAYLDNLIECENGVINEKVKYYTKLKEEYEEEKALFDKLEEKNACDFNETISKKEIDDIIKELYSLDYIGDKLKQIHTLEIKSTENYKQKGIKRVVIKFVSNAVEKLKFWSR